MHSRTSALSRCGRFRARFLSSLVASDRSVRVSLLGLSRCSRDHIDQLRHAAADSSIRDVGKGCQKLERTFVRNQMDRRTTARGGAHKRVDLGFIKNVDRDIENTSNVEKAT